MEVASQTGSELFAIEFPDKPEIEKALARMTSILRAFLPCPNGTDDRRVRRLPSVEAWMPRGAEAEQLALLGGTVPPDTAERLERRLASLVQAPEEEPLAEATVPALEDYKSPARLVALTRRALLVLEDARGTSRRSSGARAALRPGNDLIRTTTPVPARVKPEHLCAAARWPYPAARLSLSQPGNCPVFAAVHAPAALARRAVPHGLSERSTG